MSSFGRVAFYKMDLFLRTSYFQTKPVFGKRIFMVLFDQVFGISNINCFLKNSEFKQGLFLTDIFLKKKKGSQKEGAKNISWPWLSLPRVWSSLTMTFTGKSVYIAHHFILLRLRPFGLSVDRKGWWFEYFVS